ncbi:MAG: hypothetical protein ACREH4_03575 [Vitreimonas sp.]
MYTPLRLNGIPTELIVYPNDGHTLTSPEHRYYSMRAVLDWFRFWLQDYQDPDSDKAEQYARWQAMRPRAAELWRQPRPPRMEWSVRPAMK